MTAIKAAKNEKIIKAMLKRKPPTAISLVFSSVDEDKTAIEIIKIIIPKMMPKAPKNNAIFQNIFYAPKVLNRSVLKD